MSECKTQYVFWKQQGWNLWLTVHRIQGTGCHGGGGGEGVLICQLELVIRREFLFLETGLLIVDFGEIKTHKLLTPPPCYFSSIWPKWQGK